MERQRSSSNCEFRSDSISATVDFRCLAAVTNGSTGVGGTGGEGGFDRFRREAEWGMEPVVAPFAEVVGADGLLESATEVAIAVAAPTISSTASALDNEPSFTLCSTFDTKVAIWARHGASVETNLDIASASAWSLPGL